jgi:hypothetical protein
MRLTGFIALSILLAFALAAPPSAHAGCRCAIPVHTTNDVWGLANDCTAAYNAAVANAESEITCDVCWEEAVVVTQCMDKDPVNMPGVKRVDVHINYRCIICLDPLQPNPYPY